MGSLITICCWDLALWEGCTFQLHRDGTLVLCCLKAEVLRLPSQDNLNSQVWGASIAPNPHNLFHLWSAVHIHHPPRSCRCHRITVIGVDRDLRRLTSPALHLLQQVPPRLPKKVSRCVFNVSTTCLRSLFQGSVTLREYCAHFQMELPIITLCAHCPLSCHWAPRKRARPHPFHSCPLGIYEHW